MAENVNGKDLFGSGGHVWLWSGRAAFSKTLRTAGVAGAARMVVANCERQAVIGGRTGGPALLKASGGSKAVADTALNSLEADIEALIDAGTVCPWIDDQSHLGSGMVVAAYRRVGSRQYGKAGTDTTVWQFYYCQLIELDGTL